MKVAPSISIIASKLEIWRQVLESTTCPSSRMVAEFVIKELEDVMEQVIENKERINR